MRVTRLTVKQAASRLNLTPRTVRDWIKDGKLAGIQAGRKWLIDEHELAKLGVPKEDSGERDLDAGQHHRELVYFGRCLRDRLEIELPHKTVSAESAYGSVSNHATLAMWAGAPSNIYEDYPESREQAEVDNKWGFERFDGQTHPLFPFLRQHLADSPCWPALDEVETGFLRYEKASARAYRTVRGRVERRLRDLPGSDVDGMTIALLRDTHYKPVERPADPSRPYEIDGQEEAGVVWWHLRLGSISVGRERDSSALTPVVAAYEELMKQSSAGEFGAVARAAKQTQESIQEFQKLLSPDARLRKLVLTGHCELCP